MISILKHLADTFTDEYGTKVKITSDLLPPFNKSRAGLLLERAKNSS